MNKPNTSPLTRTRDPGLNAAREIMLDGDVATAAVLMNRGLITADQLRDAVMRVRAIPTGE